MGMQLFLNENDDFLPREAAKDDENAYSDLKNPDNDDIWYNSVARVMGVTEAATYALNPLSKQFYSSRSMFTCPAAVYTNGYPTPMFAIAMNSMLNKTTERVKATAIKNASKTPYFADSGILGEPKAYQYQRDYNGQPKVYATRFSGRHSTGGNIAMADGGARRYSAKKVICMDESNTEQRGRSIFPPAAVVWSPDPAVRP